MRRAILSVSDKTGLISFGQGLVSRGFELVSTGGTAKALADAGLPVVNVSDVTGFPEMMDGRVKTLHPKIHGGILARRDHPDDLALAGEHGIGLVDLVVVNLYPFVETAAKPGVAFDGPDRADRHRRPQPGPGGVEKFQGRPDRRLAGGLRRGVEGARRAQRRHHRRSASSWPGAPSNTPAPTTPRSPRRLGEVTVEGDVFSHAPQPKHPSTSAPRAPDDSRERSSAISATARIRISRPSWYALQPPAGLGAPAILQGKELSFTNLLDLDAAARIALEFEEPAAAVIKHTNPCGVATGATIAEAYVRAREADALAAFGGIIGLNRTLDEATARAIVSTFIEAVVAPGVDDAARTILAAKANLRRGRRRFHARSSDPREYRSILGAMLVQERDRVIEAHTAVAG